LTFDGINNTTRYDYDVLNRQVKVTDAKNGITSTNYDAVGNLAKITDSVGNSTTYLYDAVNRLLTDIGLWTFLDLLHLKFTHSLTTGE
jgi:YD repeat-containing protein